PAVVRVEIGHRLSAGGGKNVEVDLCGEGADNPLGDVALDLEYFLHILVIPFGPQYALVCRVDELGADPDMPLLVTETTLKQVADLVGPHKLVFRCRILD